MCKVVLKPIRSRTSAFRVKSRKPDAVEQPTVNAGRLYLAKSMAAEAVLSARIFSAIIRMCAQMRRIKRIVP